MQTGVGWGGYVLTAPGDRAATSLSPRSEDFPSPGSEGEPASASETTGLWASLLLGSFIKRVPRTSVPGGASERGCVLAADRSLLRVGGQRVAVCDLGHVKKDIRKVTVSPRQNVHNTELVVSLCRTTTSPDSRTFHHPPPGPGHPLAHLPSADAPILEASREWTVCVRRLSLSVVCPGSVHAVAHVGPCPARACLPCGSAPAGGRRSLPLSAVGCEPACERLPIPASPEFGRPPPSGVAGPCGDNAALNSGGRPDSHSRRRARPLALSGTSTDLITLVRAPVATGPLPVPRCPNSCFS